ncbi:T9SS type A sorting domain-containing protein [Aegicerativicinus sediminis]|uniref:T9SS type A sorting domain-containing protein n=1 Tax=Aegicerativicinus sediminis TaxID=2893202 RepID=UPI001E49246C|nr:T9SS type A sorting domain-containing protein [Aegicerativicinus sediminis]
MKKNYLKLMILVIVGLTFSFGQSQNLLYDGSFSQTTEIIPDTSTPPLNIWTFWTNTFGARAEANPIVEDEACTFQIINPGINTWDIQLEQYGFELIPEHSYRLVFDVKANVVRSFGVFLGEFGGNWTNLIGYDRYLQFATTEWQTISLEFNATSNFQLHKLSFELGTDITTIYFDNVVLTDLGVMQHSIGIIGTAANGWYEEVQMETTDGINYFLNNYPLKVGELKFRQDNDWIVNWGSTTFPIGVAWLNGPNIPILKATNYNIGFNRLTGEFSFICVDCLPDIGMIGSALNSWTTDVDMLTTDGIIYSLNDFYFSNGEAKFRQDNNWDINWGGDAFPTGIAVLNGPNIPVPEGTYNVTFNIETGEYKFEPPHVGIIGSSLIGWEEDVNMETEDGILYTLNDYYFNSGGVKFRTNDSWITNWGGYDFPNGFAFLNGPNIPVLEGTYIVTFNRLTGAYNFTATTCPIPNIECPWDIYVENSPGLCGAYVTYPEIVPAANCGGEISLEQVNGLPSHSFFPVGTTTNTFVLTNSMGETATCSFNVTVFDSEPPVILELNETYEPIWPANHKMVPIYIEYVTSDNCNIAFTELLISSNEPENGLGDGDKSPDWEIIDEHNILLRAERSGNGNGREYYIVIRIFDDSWNYTERQINVIVPHDNRLLSNEVVLYKENEDKFILYPNGADDVVNIKGLEMTNNSSYIIYDLFGVIKKKGVVKNNQVNVNELTQGLYILEIATENGRAYKKFIKN